MENVINLLLMIVLVYVILGIIFSIVFLWKGITKVDSGAEETGLSFKLIVLPGLVFFWPMFALKWRRS